MQYGALGLICIGLLWWVVRQDKAHRAEVDGLRAELKAEQEARVNDAKSFTNTALELQARVIAAVDTIRDIVVEYGSLGTTVGELTRVLKTRNGRERRYPDTEPPK
jgi:hypothetical protein